MKTDFVSKRLEEIKKNKVSKDKNDNAENFKKENKPIKIVQNVKEEIGKESEIKEVESKFEEYKKENEETKKDEKQKSKKLLYNPFGDSGIVNYEQFNQYLFLVFGVTQMIKNRVEEQIKQIKNGMYFGERLIIIGERGIGKSSTLFSIKKMLDKSGINVKIFSRLFKDMNHLNILLTQTAPSKLVENLSSRIQPFTLLTEKPIYFLVDFPDTVETKDYKKFLEFLWILMTHKNYNKINLIFSMNRSHFEKSFSYSEILGKFMTLRLERMNLKDTNELINSRLNLVNKKIEEIFESGVIELIYNHSKGIPRNVISACSLLISNSNGIKIDKTLAEVVLKEKYMDQVINDRVEDLELRRIYKQMVVVLRNNFNGISNSQENFVKKIVEFTGIGRNSALSRINELTKFGIFKQQRGGHNRVNKIISLE